mmetsp:Transcript_29344/g.55075  ORF Transcript_29344/g.55075 Transcript_29344/m.55075 type:complete len:134 (+) Transcript_29344:1114-1515(+)
MMILMVEILLSLTWFQELPQMKLSAAQFDLRMCATMSKKNCLGCVFNSKSQEIKPTNSTLAAEIQGGLRLASSLRHQGSVHVEGLVPRPARCPIGRQRRFDNSPRWENWGRNLVTFVCVGGRTTAATGSVTIV